MTNDQIIMDKLPEDVRIMIYAWRLLNKMGGNGSIEIHMSKGKVRETNGLFIKPGIDGIAIYKMIDIVESKEA